MAGLRYPARRISVQASRDDGLAHRIEYIFAVIAVLANRLAAARYWACFLPAMCFK